jgi:hypothetical protein
MNAWTQESTLRSAEFVLCDTVNVRSLLSNRLN